MKNINFILLSFFVLNSPLYADISPGVLEKYKNNNIFICVGIYSCINLARALNSGFREIHGIEEDEILVRHAHIIFPQDISENRYHVTNYHIHHGSLEKLQEIVFYLDKPATIFLGNNYPDIGQIKINNVLEELEIIRCHHIKTHTILIDFINHAGTPEFGNVSLDDIKSKLLEINSNYVFHFEKGGCVEREDNAILVACVQ